MTQWNFCPECKTELSKNKDGYLACPKGHFTKYETPVAATIGLIRFDNKYLSIKRAHAPRKGYWDLPGGFVDPGETALQTLLREIDEETSLNVKPVFYVGTFPSTYGEWKTATLGTTYLFESSSDKVSLSEENTEYKWFELHEMPEMAFADCEQAIKVLQNKLKNPDLIT